jgi:hypothetical protein
LPLRRNAQIARRPHDTNEGTVPAKLATIATVTQQRKPTIMDIVKITQTTTRRFTYRVSSYSLSTYSHCIRTGMISTVIRVERV